jgi:hypothetical protein
MDGRGNFVVGWVDYDVGTSDGVFARRFSRSGRALGDTFQVNSYTTADQDNPSMAIDDAGNFTVVWQSRDQDGSGSGIFAQRYDSSGMAQGGESQVNSANGGDQDDPSVSMDASGRFVVVWRGPDLYGAGNSEIFGQRYDSLGAKQGTEYSVNSYFTGDQSRPVISMAATGDVVVVWESNDQDGSGAGIFGQRYDSSGAKAGAEFRVNTYTSGDQTDPKVAMDAQRNFVVVWESDHPPGGQFGQFYDGAGATVGGEFHVTRAELLHKRTEIAADDASRFIMTFDGVHPSEDTIIKRLQRPPCVAAVPSLEVEPADGGSSLKLTWPNVYAANSYVVYEKTIPYGAFFTETGTAPSGPMGLTVPMPAGNRFYLVAARKASCGEGRKR